MEYYIRKALKGSIEKWRMIIEEGESDEGISNCPLCNLFYEDGCRGCPVAEAVKVPYCGHTPYSIWADLTSKYDCPVADTPEKLEAAKAEKAFLESLLNEGGRND